MADKQMSADEAAVAAAEQSFGKGGGAMPSSQMGAEGGLSAKAPGKPMTKAEMEEKEREEEEEKEKACKKSDDADEDDKKKKKDGEEEEEEEEEMEKETKKSGMSADDLMKAMDVLEATAEGIGGEPDRRAELASKVADGTISKAERAELFELLGGQVDTDDDGDGEDFGKSFSEIFASDEQLAQDYDVTPFIERQSQLVAGALDSMRDGLAKSTGEQQIFNRALAKSFKGIGQVVTEQGELIKSLHAQNQALSERLGVVETTPNQRKGRTSAQPLKKSFAGGDQAIGGLNEQQITEGLNRLMVKSRENNFLAPCGEPIDRAVTLYETERKITRGMLRDVATEMGVSLQQ